MPTLNIRTPKLARSAKCISDIRTKTDNKCDQCLQLFRLAALLNEAIPHLKQVCSLLSNKDSLITHRRRSAIFMKKFDIPLIEKAVDLINSAAAGTCPLAGMKEHFRKMHNDEIDRIAATNLSRDISPEQYMISLFLSETTAVSPKKASQRSAKMITPSSRKDSNKPGYHDYVDPDNKYNDIHLPLPENESTSVYTKPEAAEILSKTEKGSSVRTRTMSKMIKTGVAPTSFRTLRRIMKEKDEGRLVLDNGWGQPKGGRKRKMNDGEIIDYISSIKTGQSIGKKEISEALTQAHKKRVIRSGGVPIVAQKVSYGTVVNYKTEFAMHPKMSCTQCVTDKNRARITAMESLRGAVGLLGLVATTHFIPIEEEDTDIKKIVDSMSDSDRWLYDYVCKRRGGYQYPVKPCYLTNTDDSKQYHYVGAVESKIHPSSHKGISRSVRHSCSLEDQQCKDSW